MNDIMKIVQAFKDSNTLLNGVTKTVKNVTKEQKGGFLSMFLGTIGASLLGNILAGKGILRAGSGNKKGKGVVREKENWLWKRMRFIMPPHPLTNFKIQKYYQNEPKFNAVYSRNYLPKKIKDGVYVINIDEYAEVGTHWISLFCEIVCFDSFGVEHVPDEIKEFVGNKNINANNFRVQANDSVMCGYFCTGFIDFMLAGKKLTDFTSMFSPYDLKKNDNIVLSYFKDE